MEINHFYAADDFTGEQCVLLSDHIASHAYDEAKERELFEAAFKDAHGYSPLLNWDGSYEHGHSRGSWDGWIMCAKSRALSAE